MNKLLAKKKFIDYLKENQIPYQYINETDKLRRLEDIDTIYVCTEVEMVIGGHVETSIRFFDDYMYVQTYFCQPVVNSNEEEIRAARMANFLNGNVSYDCDELYSPVYVADNGGDFYRGLLIRYELYREFFYESMNHILNFSVQQLTELGIPLIFYLSGKCEYEEATEAFRNHNFRGHDLSVIYK